MKSPHAVGGEVIIGTLLLILSADNVRIIKIG